MLQSHDTIKTVNVLWGKSKAKVVEWEPRNYPRGIKYIPVEVHATTSQLRARESTSEQPRAEINDMLWGETAYQPMDVDEAFWVDDLAIPNSKRRVRQPLHTFLVNLICLSVPKHLHWRISPQNWPLSTLPPWLWGHSTSDSWMPGLQVCSVQMEVLWLLSCTCALQGMLSEVTPAAFFSQSSKVDWELLHAIVVAGDWGVLTIGALWGPVPESNCAL